MTILTRRNVEAEVRYLNTSRDVKPCACKHLETTSPLGAFLGWRILDFIFVYTLHDTIRAQLGKRDNLVQLLPSNISMSIRLAPHVPMLQPRSTRSIHDVDRVVLICGDVDASFLWDPSEELRQGRRVDVVTKCFCNMSSRLRG